MIISIRAKLFLTLLLASLLGFFTLFGRDLDRDPGRDWAPHPSPGSSMTLVSWHGYAPTGRT